MKKKSQNRLRMITGRGGEWKGAIPKSIDEGFLPRWENHVFFDGEQSPERIRMITWSVLFKHSWRGSGGRVASGSFGAVQDRFKNTLFSCKKKLYFFRMETKAPKEPQTMTGRGGQKTSPEECVKGFPTDDIEHHAQTHSQDPASPA